MYLEEMDALVDLSTQETSFFRVDRHLFEEGELIKSSREYVSKLTASQNEVEFLIEGSRPKHLLSRSEALFVFADVKDAIRFCSKLTDSYVYEVVHESTNGIHRADMNIVEVLYKTTCEHERRIWAHRYWDVECVVGYPCYEYLVTSAKVKRKLFSYKECLSMMQSQRTMYQYIAEKYLK